MNAPASQTWSRSKWVGWIAACFLAHVGLIVLLGARPAAAPPPASRFHAALAETLTSQFGAWPEYEDPALFALPNPLGFSGAAWMRPAAPPHQFHEWAEAQRWLALNEVDLGATFVQHVRSLAGSNLAITEKQPPKSAPPELSGAADWLPRESRLRVEGAMAGRRLARRVALPAWPTGEVLGNTVAQVLVDQRGWVLSATVIEESGAAAADEAALQLARQLVFEKASTPGLTSGRVVFEWHTLPLTNAPAIIPPP